VGDCMDQLYGSSRRSFIIPIEWPVSCQCRCQSTCDMPDCSFQCIDDVCSVALGYDEGTAMIKIGREEPVASMDSSGKIIWAHHNEIQTVNVKSLGADSEDVSVRYGVLGTLSLLEHTKTCRAHTYHGMCEATRQNVCLFVVLCNAMASLCFAIQS